MRRVRMLLLPLLFAAVGCGEDNPMQWTFEPFSQVLVDSTFTVSADAFESFFVNVTVDDAIRDIVLQGEFTVVAGGDKDIQVFVMRDEEFFYFLMGEEFSALHGTTQVPSGEFTIPIMYSDRYHVVFSNKFSATTDRTVSARVVVHWEEQVTTVPDE